MRRHKISKLKILLLILAAVIIALVVFAIIFLIKLDKPVSAKVQSTQESASGILAYNINLTPVYQSGKYASFDYPKGLKLVSTTLGASSSLEDFTYYVKDIYSWTLAIDVGSYPDGVLSENSSYLFREENPHTYSKSSETIHGMPITIMTDNSFSGGFSKVAFIPYGNYIATISLMGNDTSGIGPLVTTFNMVLGSWHWQ